MIHRALVVCSVVLLAGCVTPTPEVTLPFPKPKDSFYDAPDGRRWVLHLEEHTPNGIDTLGFTSEPAIRAKWKEQLMFSCTTKDLSIEGLRKSFGEVQEIDPGFTYSISRSRGALLVKYTLPKWNSRGVQKCVRVGKTFNSVGYEERIGSEADERLEFWTTYLESLPGETLGKMRLR